MPEKNEIAVLDELQDFTMPDLNLPSVMEIRDSVMDIEELPDKAAIIIALRAMGFMPSRIAKMVGCTDKAVYKYIERYDPEKKCMITPEDRRLITTQMMQSTAVEALMCITHEKLKGSSAKALADIATKCAAAVEKLNLSKQIGDHMSSSRVHSMLDALDVGEEG